MEARRKLVKQYAGNQDSLKLLSEIQEISEQLLKIPDFGKIAAAQFRQKQYELWLALPDRSKVAHTKT